jgi:proteic killer suppression protein
MIRSFEDRGTRDIFEQNDTKAARRALPQQIWPRAQAKLSRLDVAADLRELNTPSNRLEKLSGNREGQHSIRINRQYRICFGFRDADAWDVEITDYH